MHSHFQILLRGYMGLWENLGGGPLFLCFIFYCNFSKSFEGVLEVPPPPSSPIPVCIYEFFICLVFLALKSTPLLFTQIANIGMAAFVSGFLTVISSSCWKLLNIFLTFSEVLSRPAAPLTSSLPPRLTEDSEIETDADDDSQSIENAWRGDGDSDAESVDSEMENPLK